MSITLSHISHAYFAGTDQELEALRDVSFSVADGEILGIMGQTGCGKTTLLQIMAGLLCPTKGQVLLDGEDIFSPAYPLHRLPEKVGIVFQFPETQLFASTVEKDVAFALKHRGLSRTQQREKVRRALTAMGFSYEEICTRSPLTLSGGERRRVAIAGVLVSEPQLLIFDEPVAGLDPRSRQEFLHLVKKLKENGTSVILVSHNADALSETADRLLLLHQGRLMAAAPTAAVLSDQKRLASLGLRTSQAAELAGLLSDAGLSLPEAVVTYEGLLDALCSRLKGGAS